MLEVELLLVEHWSFENYRITQNGRAWKGPLWVI